MQDLLTPIRFGFCLYFFTILVACGQLVPSASSDPSTTSSAATVSLQTLPNNLTFQQQSQNLAQQLVALNAQGATFQQLQSWLQQNVAPLQQQALAFALISPVVVSPYISEVEIPDGATQEMISFLSTNADLINRFAQLHNQQARDVTDSSARANALPIFQKQNGSEIELRQHLAQVIATQSAQQLVPIPLPLVIPPGSSPQMTAFLTLRDRIIRSQVRMQNQNAASSAALRAAAVQLWEQQNSADLQTLQQMSQNLANPPPN